MKKKVLKEYDGILLGVDIIFYSMFVIIGSILLESQYLEHIKAVDYTMPIFYCLGFFSLVAYFVNRRPDDYEFLFFGLINIIIATYISNNNFYDSSIILGRVICLYTLAVALNKSYATKALINKDDYDMIPNLISTILLTILGIFVSYHFINGMAIESILLGYYFIGFGIFGLLEPLLKILFRIPKVRNYLDEVFSSDMPVHRKTKKIIKNKIVKINKSKNK